MLKTRERTIFPKLNMTGDTKVMRNGIIAAKPLLRYTITKETIKTSRRLEFCSSMRRKRESKHNQKPEERSSYGFNHREARMVICCVYLVKEYD